MQLLEAVLCHQDSVADYYRSIISTAPAAGIAWDVSLNGWLVTGYRACAGLLRSRRLTRARPLSFSGPEDLVECARRIMTLQAMLSDDQEAEARRKVWRRQLTSSATADGHYGSMARELLFEVRDRGRMDIYADVLQPFASRVAFHAAGFNEAARDDLYPLVAQYVRLVDGKTWQHEEVLKSLVAIVLLFDGLSARADGDRIPDGYARDKWISDWMFVLIAGHESTAYLIATVLREAAGCPVAPSEVGSWILEASRFDAPVQLIGRTAASSFELGGVLVEAGDRVYLHLGAANRDSAVFDAPERFRPGRSEAPPLAFGAGFHQCPGRSLATSAAKAFLSTAATERLWPTITSARGDHGIAGRGWGWCEAYVDQNASV